MLMAAGLVAALLVGATALSFGLSGGGSAAAETATPEPIVRTIHRTITVQEEANAAPVEVVRVTADPTQGSDASLDDGSWDEADDALEYDDDGDEDDHDGSDDDGDDHGGSDDDGDEGGDEHEDD